MDITVKIITCVMRQKKKCKLQHNSNLFVLISDHEKNNVL